MQTNQILATFCGTLLVLGLIAFFLGRAKAARVRAGGTSMHAQPDQYAWFTVLSTAGPAI
ncbi:phosphate ABC transporter permease family protein, partial [Halomonas elongata]